MDTMEWMDEMLDLRIEALMRERPASVKDDGGKYGQVLEQAEAVLKKLSMEDWETMERFQDMVTEQCSKDSSYLYVCGLKDGIQVMKFIGEQ